MKVKGIRDIIPTAFDKPFYIKWEAYKNGSGDWRKGEVFYDKDEFIFIINTPVDKGRIKMKEAKLAQMIRDGEYKIISEDEFNNNECHSCPSESKPLEEIPESFTDCLKRNGINLEKETHLIEVGTIVRDIHNQVFKITAFKENEIDFEEYSLLNKSRTGANFSLSYDEFIGFFDKDEIFVKGFSPEEKMEFTRVLNTIQHCVKMDALHKENEDLKKKTRLGYYTIESLENAGFKYTGESYPAPSITLLSDLARKYNVSISSIRLFRLDDYEYGAFYNTVVEEGFKETPLLPSDQPSVETVTSPESLDSDTKEAIEGLQALLSVTTDKKEKKEIKAAIAALKLL